MTFRLDPRLEEETVWLGDLELSRVLLRDDRRFGWLILVPRRADLRELHRLDPAERSLLIEEIALVAEALETETGADKMNVAALGNLVPQLHIHVIARKEGDAAWPGPVWGVGTREPFAPDRRAALGQALKDRLALTG